MPLDFQLIAEAASHAAQEGLKLGDQSRQPQLWQLRLMHPGALIERLLELWREAQSVK